MCIRPKHWSMTGITHFFPSSWVMCHIFTHFEAQPWNQNRNKRQPSSKNPCTASVSYLWLCAKTLADKRWGEKNKRLLCHAVGKNLRVELQCSDLQSKVNQVPSVLDLILFGGDSSLNKRTVVSMLSKPQGWAEEEMQCRLELNSLFITMWTLTSEEHDTFSLSGHTYVSFMGLL